MFMYFPSLTVNLFAFRCKFRRTCNTRPADLIFREDLNTLVKRHIQTVVTSTPNRALNMLESDAAELIAAGMVTLNAKLMGVHDNKLIARVVETWNFFWDQVLTYVEGVSSRCRCLTLN